MTGVSDSLGREAYALICARDGVTAREIARELGANRKEVNRLLYGDPFIRDLCYRDGGYRWRGLIRHGFPHEGLSDYCGWYGTASDFRAQGEDEWLSELEEGCRRIGRNLNDARLGPVRPCALPDHVGGHAVALRRGPCAVG